MSPRNFHPLYWIFLIDIDPYHLDVFKSILFNESETERLRNLCDTVSSRPALLVGQKKKGKRNENDETKLDENYNSE